MLVDESSWMWKRALFGGLGGGVDDDGDWKNK